MTITTPSFGTARYIKMGNIVVATIDSINAATFTITTAATDTNFVLGITGLPTPYRGSGIGYLRVNSGYYATLPLGIVVSATQIGININSATGVGVSNGVTVAGAGCFTFIYLC